MAHFKAQQNLLYHPSKVTFNLFSRMSWLIKTKLFFNILQL